MNVSFSGVYNVKTPNAEIAKKITEVAGMQGSTAFVVSSRESNDRVCRPNVLVLTGSDSKDFRIINNTINFACDKNEINQKLIDAYKAKAMNIDLTDINKPAKKTNENAPQSKGCVIRFEDIEL